MRTRRPPEPAAEEQSRSGSRTRRDFPAVDPAPRSHGRVVSEVPLAPAARPYERRSEPAMLSPFGANRCKGLVFDSALDLIGERFGATVLSEVKERLPEAVRDAVRGGGLVKGGWYPLAWYDALHVAAQQATGRGVDLPREIGRESTRRDLTRGAYRVFLKILWPDLVLQKAPLIFNRYFEQGEMTVAAPEPAPFDLGGSKSVLASWSGCAGFTENIWQDVMGGCEGGLIAAGARDVAVEITGGVRARGATCTARASYR